MIRACAVVLLCCAAAASRAEPYGPVLPGDRAFAIVRQYRDPESDLNFRQWVLALFAANRDQFGHSPDQLRAGAQLRIPTHAQVHALWGLGLRLEQGERLDSLSAQINRVFEASTSPTSTTVGPLSLTDLADPALEQPSSSADIQDYAPVRVWLNGEDRGDALIRIEDDLPCLDRPSLIGFGVPTSALPPDVSKAGCVSESPPSLQIALEPASARLLLNVAPLLLPEQRRSYAVGHEAEPVAWSRSMYLNYAVNVSQTQAAARLDWQAPLETMARQGRWRFDGTWLAQADGVQRQLSSLRYDMPEQLAALRFGDVTPVTGRFGSGALLGLQWGSEFAYEPFRRRAPGLGYTGVLDTPSTVELFVDGRSVTRLQLPAGPYVLDDLPVWNNGVGALSVEITDAFGNRRVVEQPFYLGSGLLSAGEREFDVAVGLPRVATDRYGDRPAVRAAWRRGFTDQLTLGLEASATSDRYLLGGEAGVSLGRLGQLSGGAFAGGEQQRLDGYVFVGHQYLFYGAYSNLEYSWRGDNFLSAPTVAAPAGTQGERRLRAQLGTRLRSNLGLAVNATYLAPDDQASERTWGIALNARVLRAWNLSAQLQQTVDGDTAVTLSFSGSPTRRSLARVSMRDDAELRSNEASIDVLPIAYVDNGFRFDYARDEFATGLPQERWSAEAQRRAERYTARLSYRTDAVAEVTNGGLAGSVVWTDATVGFGQPVRGSFALVQLEALDGVEVYADGRRIGESTRLPLVVSDLSPWTPHTLSMRLPESLPLGLDIPRTSERIKLASGAGRALSFEARALRIFEARIERPDGVAVSFAPVQVRAADGAVLQTVTGEDGYLYLENLSAGAYELELGGKRSCRIQLELPLTEQLVSRLGTLVCLERDA